MMAPLEDTTDNALRELCFRHGADLTFTPMARLSGLVRRNKSTEKKIETIFEIEKPVLKKSRAKSKLKFADITCDYTLDWITSRKKSGKKPGSFR